MDTKYGQVYKVITGARHTASNLPRLSTAAIIHAAPTALYSTTVSAIFVNSSDFCVRAHTWMCPVFFIVIISGHMLVMKIMHVLRPSKLQNDQTNSHTNVMH